MKNEISAINLFEMCNAINGENPNATFGVSHWPLEPNTLGIFKRTGAYTSEWMELIQSDNAQRLYKATRSLLRQTIYKA